MVFKDLKIGSPFFILKKDEMEIVKSSITNITAPHIENKLNSVTQMVVDITINVDGKPVTYVTPDSSVVTYCGTQLLTADKSVLINEIKAIKTQHEQVLASYDKSKEIVDKCDILISDLDDAFREKKENDERLSKLEMMMQKLLDTFTKKEEEKHTTVTDTTTTVA
jgi:hypothetical protein